MPPDRPGCAELRYDHGNADSRVASAPLWDICHSPAPALGICASRNQKRGVATAIRGGHTPFAQRPQLTTSGIGSPARALRTRSTAPSCSASNERFERHAMCGVKTTRGALRKT